MFGYDLGLWGAVSICLGFSAFVIIADEIMHARIRKRREQGEGPQTH
jgi:hypothetical protein